MTLNSSSGPPKWTALPDWHPDKPGVLTRSTSGEFLPFATEVDTMCLPELIAHYEEVAQNLYQARLRSATAVEAQHVVDAEVTINSALEQLRRAYEAVRFTYGKTGQKYITGTL